MSQHDDAQEWPRELALDDAAGPAALISRAEADDLVCAALDQAGFGELQGQRISGVARAGYAPKPGLGARSLAAAAVLALLSIGSASAAVMWWGQRHEAVAPPAARAVQGPTRGGASERALPSTLGTPAPAAPVATPEAAPEAPRPAPHRLLPQAPEDWLVLGNRLRSERRWSEADAAYTRAARAAPHTQTAYVAQVAAAAVRLEHLHDARRALSSYRSALKQAPHGPLTEEIDWGIAEAYRGLGERAAERRALVAFVRDHPSSPLLALAKARLD